MNYQKNVAAYKDTDITKEFCLYHVWLPELGATIKKKVRQEFDCDDDHIWLTENQIMDMDVPYDAVDWDSCIQEDDFLIEENLNAIVKKAAHYLVILEHYRWDGGSGCRIVDNVRDAFYRDYDCCIYPEAVTRGGKVLKLRESHHDCPMGHTTYIVALTEREYEFLDTHLFWGDSYTIQREIARMTKSFA